MKFQESKTAHKYLDGLRGLEIGASAHNPFGLNALNVDYTDEITVYKKQEIELCGEYAKVDIVSDGANLPFKDKTMDFIINSHCLEHFFDTIGTFEEWVRVAKKYILIIVPKKQLTFDKDKPTTPLSELIGRYEGSIIPSATAPADDHHTIFDSESFLEFCNYVCEKYNLKIVVIEDPDFKVNNGMLALFEIL